MLSFRPHNILISKQLKVSGQAWRKRWVPSLPVDPQISACFRRVIKQPMHKRDLVPLCCGQSILHYWEGFCDASRTFSMLSTRPMRSWCRRRSMQGHRGFQRLSVVMALVQRCATSCPRPRHVRHPSSGAVPYPVCCLSVSILCKESAYHSFHPDR